MTKECSYIVVMDRRAYTGRVRALKRIRVGVLSPDEIRRRSVCEISKPLPQDKNLAGTIRDPRLGVIELGTKNPITRLTNTSDTGSFGHLNLAKPVVMFPFFSDLAKVLDCVCYDCRSIKLAPEQRTKVMKAHPKARIAMIHKFAGVGTTNPICPVCELHQPKFVKLKKDKDTGQERVLTIGARFSSKEAADTAADSLGVPTPEEEQAAAPAASAYAYSIAPVTSAAAASKAKTKKLSTIIFDECMILCMLETLTDEDVHLLGLDPNFSHPSWMIWTVLPISPMTMRPTAKLDNGKLSEDDLTHKYVDIVRINARLRKEMEEQRDSKDKENRNPVITKYWNQLRYHCATLIDNESSTLPKAVNRSQRPLKTIKQRITPKSGRIRGNLMGKRVNKTGRTVISPNPEIDMDEVSVPLRIAKTLTYPETVSKHNIDFLQKLVASGNTYPGAKSVVINVGDKPITRYLGYANRASIQLHPGDVVNRFLMDGDYALVNRQPSLHRMSIMCHRIKVVNAKTIGLSLSVTSPYNADFDGDEMNLHIPVSTIAVIEASTLMHVPTQIVSPQNGKAIMGLVQDGVTGSYRLSKQAKPISWMHTMRYAATLKSYDGTLPIQPQTESESESWSAPSTLPLDLISYILPNITAVCPGAKEHPVKVKTGTIQPCAIFTKGTVGASKGGLMHVINNDHGPYAAQAFCDDMKTIVDKWFADTGFSVGMADITIPDAAHHEIHEATVRELKKVNDHIMEFRTGNKSRKDIDFDVSGLGEQMERDVLNSLNALKNKIQEIAIKALNNLPDNHFLDMVLSGAKGSSSNAAQIVAGLGQQDIDSKRIQNDYPGRSTAHFTQFDYSPESRGFVKSSYGQGLNPIEFIIHAKAGRVGIISTSVGTAETGYLQRKTIKMTEDLHVGYDRTVRSGTGRIVQYFYGQDGLDGAHVESQSMDENYDINAYQQKFRHPESVAGTELENVLIAEEYVKLKADREYMLNYIKKYGTEEKYYFVANFGRIESHATELFGLDKSVPTRLDPGYVIPKVKDFIAHVQKTFDPTIGKYANRFFLIALRAFFSTKRLHSKGYTKEAFDYTLKTITSKFYRGRIEPGESVGVIASQSIGEPSTQMTLDVFHNTGVGQKANVSRGVPRLTEIYNASKNPKTPSMTVYMKDEYLYAGLKDKTNEEIQRILDQRVRYACSELEHVKISDLINESSVSFVFDPLQSDKVIPEKDTHLVQFYDEIAKNTGNDANSHARPSWIIRFEFDKKSLITHSTNMCEIEAALLRSFDTQFDTIVSDDSADTLVARVGITNIKSDEDINLKLCAARTKIMEISVKGIANIGKCSERRVIRDTILPSGEVISKIKAGQISDDDGIIDLPSIGRIYSQTRVIDTSGSNISKVLSLPFVDSYRTVSNHIREVDELYGIEAARTVIMEEILEILDYAGSNVNPRHIEIFADLMTHQGEIITIDRNGMRKTENQVLAKISFEEPCKRLANAAMYSEFDNLQGVSGNIMFAQPVKVGTGSFSVSLDEELLFANLKDNEVPSHRAEEYVVNEEEAQAKLTEISETTMCANEDLSMSYVF